MHPKATYDTLHTIIRLGEFFIAAKTRLGAIFNGTEHSVTEFLNQKLVMTVQARKLEKSELGVGSRPLF